MLAFFDIKRYINPALASALYRKKNVILPLSAPFTVALQKRYLKQKKEKTLYKLNFVVVNGTGRGLSIRKF